MHQNIRVCLEPELSPLAWVRAILNESNGKSAATVQKHLVGAKLQIRFPDLSVPNDPGHLQTGRLSDFDMGSVSYLVTANPGIDVIEKCKANMNANRRPVLVVPAERVPKAKALADFKGITDRVAILALEDFVAQNVMGISADAGRDCYATLQEIIKEYNRRIEESETDMALKIELL